MMKKYSYFSALCLAAALTFTACSQDELGDGGDTLPEGKYPLEISSVTIEAESSVQPWGAKTAQTRVSEHLSADSTTFDSGDAFYVKFDGSDEVGTYKFSEYGTVNASKPVYWSSTTEKRTIIAWYAPDADADGKLNLSDQSNKFIYVFRALANNITYSSNVSLTFSSQLARVIVRLTGDKASSVNSVTINSYTSCVLKENKTVGITDADETGEIAMRKYVNGWYAHVVPGQAITVSVDGTAVSLNETITPQAGNCYEITIEVK